MKKAEQLIAQLYLRRRPELVALLNAQGHFLDGNSTAESTIAALLHELRTDPAFAAKLDGLIHSNWIGAAIAGVVSIVTIIAQSSAQNKQSKEVEKQRTYEKEMLTKQDELSKEASLFQLKQNRENIEAQAAHDQGITLNGIMQGIHQQEALDRQNSIVSTVMVGLLAIGTIGGAIYLNSKKK